MIYFELLMLVQLIESFRGSNIVISDIDLLSEVRKDILDFLFPDYNTWI